LKTSTFKAKVARKARWWAASTVIILAILLTVGYAVTTLIVAIPVAYQGTLLYIFGAAGTIIAFLLGQACNSILVRSWNTWIGDLGSTQIAMLIPELQKQKERLEKEE
jgi:peptidoglycan/LPS O-acetylase OafA/YrhL